VNANPEIWLDQARKRPSDNRDERPADAEVDLLVIHSISLPPGEFGGGWIDDLFMNRLDPDAHPYFREIAHLKVSSHLLIRRDGQLIQYVPLNQRAWHAGVSSYCGRAQCNDFSIGIELEGADDQPFTDAQYLSLRQTTEAVVRLYPAIGLNRITGHANIAPGRKTDPGPLFDWPRYLSSLKQAIV
jgi:N-acetyl-anhydromuramoyl-L-alanine amidase